CRSCRPRSAGGGKIASPPTACGSSRLPAPSSPSSSSTAPTASGGSPCSSSRRSGDDERPTTNGQVRRRSFVVGRASGTLAGALVGFFQPAERRRHLLLVA